MNRNISPTQVTTASNSAMCWRSIVASNRAIAVSRSDLARAAA